MKNIWIINQYTGSPYYGMNYRSYYLGKEFVEEGNKVTIFAGTYSHLFVNFPNVSSMFTSEKIDGINYSWIKTPKYKNSRSIGRIWNMLVFMFKLFFVNIFKYEKPDIIIVSSLSIFPVLNAYIWSKLLKIEFIFEVRDIWPLTLIEVGGMSRYHPLVIVLGWFEKLGYKKAKYVVSVLPFSYKHMIKKGMAENKFRYIPNGINLDEVENYDEISTDIKSVIPTDKFIVGYVGTLGIANALDYLLDVIKSLKENMDIYFIIVGKGGEVERYKNFVFDNELENITFIPAIPKIQVQSMLKTFDICYLGWHDRKIYKYGISANKLFDYMYSEKPILHSININDDLVKQAKCGITVKAEDIEAIKDAILRFYRMNDDELKKMGHNGKEYVIKYHTYNALVKDYIVLF